MAYVDLFTLKQIFIDGAEMAALAIMKLQSPSFDEVRYKEAVRIAGSERWLKYHIDKGNLTKIRRGTATNSPIYYSRLEIAAVKKAEATEQRNQ